MSRRIGVAAGIAAVIVWIAGSGYAFDDLEPLLPLSPSALQTPELSIRLIGNAGVALSDGTTSLLVDLPYEPGAFGYARYDPAALRPEGDVVAVITHHHRDHFDPDLFLARAGWRVVGPGSVTKGLPPDRVLPGDSVSVGAFSVVAVPTPHTDDHRSYRIRWRGRVLHFAGDTDDAATVPSERRIDLLFVTPWLDCGLTARAAGWDRAVLYHLHPDGTDRVCGSAEVLEPGTVLRLTARRSP